MTNPTFYRDPVAPNRFWYIPGDPTPELAPNGAPTLSLWVTHPDARLQLGVQWKLTPGETEQLVRTIARQFPSLTPAMIDLQPALVRVQAVDLLVRNAMGELASVATAISSGFPPYTTLFAVSLTAEQKIQAISALHGRTGFLAVRYCLEASNGQGGTDLIERTADIGQWFMARRGDDHIHVLPAYPLTPTQPSAPISLSVGLEESLKDAPIAFVQLESGSTTAALRPPMFDPVLLPLVDGALRCTTHYKQGKPYSVVLSNLSTDSPYSLTPADLGLAEIVVTAPAYQAAQAREVRVQVRYLPAGDGADDERTVYLRGNTWRAEWWVITRHPTLNGVLEITAKITAADGASFTPPRYRQEEGGIVIAEVNQ